MKISIKNPAPSGPTMTKWGDYHFGISLQRALERRGIRVVQDFWPDWDGDDDADAVIVLRGKRGIVPPADGRPWLLWIISHPAAVTLAEVNAYTIVCPASETMCGMIGDAAQAHVQLLRQCTDATLFRMAPDDGVGEPEGRRGLLFVANSRKVMRVMLQWAESTGLRPDLFGKDWKQFGLQDFVVRDYVDNSDLPDIYRSYALSLNDHWADMRHFGMINNRIFDCLACGLPVLSDWFPELDNVFGGGLLYASNETEYWDSVWRARLRWPDVAGEAMRTWENMAGDYTFDARAEQIIALLSNPPGKRRAGRTTGIALEADAGGYAEAIVNELQAESGDRVRRVLHLHPARELASGFLGRDKVEYVSAGIGDGPWEVALDSRVSQLLPGSFDVIVLDESALTDPIEDAELGQFLGSLCKVLNQCGSILVIDTDAGKGEGERWSRFLDENEGFVGKQVSGFHRAYRRHLPDAVG